MERLTRYLRRMCTDAGAMSWPMRMLGALLAVLIVGGGVWLIVACLSASPMTAVFNHPLNSEALTTLAGRLDRHGIAYRIEGRSLLAPPQSHGDVRRMFADVSSTSGLTASSLQLAADDDDIWRTSEQNKRRWQVAKMAWLSEQIMSFPQVRTATVILDAGSPGKLGRCRVPATAAVKVALVAGNRMSSSLVGAIADMVVGSVAGMKRGDVHIIDAEGRSHLAAAGLSPAQAADPIERIRRSEDYYEQRIRDVLGFVNGAIISVQVDASSPERPLLPCVGASISVPRRYFTAAYASAGAGEAEDIETFISARTARMRSRVASAAGLSSDNADKTIAIDLHYDACAPGVAAGSLAADRSRSGTLLWPAAGAASLAVLAGAVLLTWRLAGNAASRNTSEVSPGPARGESQT
ncbi:MAG: hypothetical protein J7M14_01295, partial [Planctomycetes bacterium]|nr:hypothetical protein [Planctomycetota bacterium]